MRRSSYLWLVLLVPWLGGWTAVSGTTYSVDKTTVSTARYDFTTKVDSTVYDLSSCSSVRARFDPSIGDASEDAVIDLLDCPSSSATRDQCQSVRFTEPPDSATFRSTSFPRGYAMVRVNTAPTGGDTARVDLECTSTGSSATTDLVSDISRVDADCDALTDGVEGQVCTEADGTLYICQPTSGGCDTAGEWIVSGGTDNLGDHTATQDVGLNSFALTQNSLTLSSTGLAHAAGVADTFWSRLVDAGPVMRCSAASSNADAICNDNSQCTGGGTCVRAGTSGTTAQDQVTMALALTATSGGNVWDSQDNVFKMCWNYGANCSGIEDTAHHAFTKNVETDYHEDGVDWTSIEDYLQVINEGKSPETWRPRFWRVDPFNGRANLSTRIAEWYATDTGAAEEFAGLMMGSPLGGDAIVSGIALGPRRKFPSGSGILNEQTDRFGNTPFEFNQAAPILSGQNNTLAVQGDGTGQRSALVNSVLVEGSNIYGACGGTPTGGASVGQQCLWNTDCNGGTEYDGATATGICVKGDDVAGSGTDDGVCVVNPGTNNSITNLCATVGAATGTCDSPDTNATSQCIDIQSWYPMRAAAAAGDIASIQINDPGTTPNLVDITPGYCSASGGQPEDEGRLCFKAADCSSNSCLKPNAAGSPHYTGSGVARQTNIVLASTMPGGHANNPVSSTANEINSLDGHDYVTTISGSNQVVSSSRIIFIASPTYTGSGNTFSNPAGIRIGDQWANSEYRPDIFRIDSLTATGSGSRHLFRQDSFGWDSGNHRFGDLRMWNQGEGTSGVAADGLRINLLSQDASVNPTSATDGFLLQPMSKSNNYGLMAWGISDASGAATFDTGTEICAALNADLTCVDSDVMGSDGSATTCATAHANGSNFWAMCRD